MGKQEQQLLISLILHVELDGRRKITKDASNWLAEGRNRDDKILMK